jgi:phospholipid/cholesterol/gamma-HCH transport system substrate-binding protein
MPDGRLRVRIGLFVVLALVLFGIMVLMFGNYSGLFRSTRTYYIRFTDAPGIAVGAPVRRSGVRIGEVTDVVLEPQGDVKVTVAVDSRYVVRRNEDPTLTTGLIGPDARIDIIPRKRDPGQPPPDTSTVPPGSELVGITLVSVNALVNRAAEVVPTTQETLKKIGDSMENLQKTVDRLTPVTEDTLKEYRALAQDVRREIPGLRRSNDELLKVLQTANQELPKVSRNVNETLTSAKATAEDLGAAARTYQKLGERANLWLTDNEQELTAAVKNLNKTLQTTNRFLDQASDVVNDENRRNFSRLLTNTTRASEELTPLAKNANTLINDGRESMQRINATLTRMNEVLNNLQQATKPLGETTPRILRNLDETADRLNKTASDVRDLIKAVGSSNGTLYRILNDPSLYNRLDEALCQFNKSLPRFDRILKDLETFADKLARHPESIGAGGVIRPGSGLKDPSKP